MKVSNLELSESAQNSNLDDAEALEKLKATVERAIADCRLSREERDDIMRRIYADGQVSVKECEIWRLLQEKIWEGEIKID